MKVYLDMQLWSYIQTDEATRKVFLDGMRNSGWKYYISVAHLEELNNNEKTAPPKKKATVLELRKLIRVNVEAGVITPSFEGLILDDYEAADFRVKACDTRGIIRELSNTGFEARNSLGVNPADLFKGVTYSTEEAYRKVWDLEFVQGMSKNFFIGEIEDYDVLKNDYQELESTMTLLYLLLTTVGFKREKTAKKFNSAEYDIQHSICATFCDAFVTADQKFADKFKAVAYRINIPTKIIVYDNKTKTLLGMDS